MKALQLGNLANAAFYAAMGTARKGWHLYAACEFCSTQCCNAVRKMLRCMLRTLTVDAWYTLSMFGSCTYSAQTAMSMVEATAAGLGQGELQAGMSTLNSISHMLVSRNQLARLSSNPCVAPLCSTVRELLARRVSD